MATGWIASRRPGECPWPRPLLPPTALILLVWLAPLTEALATHLQPTPLYYLPGLLLTTRAPTYNPLLYTTCLTSALDRGPRVVLHHHLGAWQVGGSVRCQGWSTYSAGAPGGRGIGSVGETLDCVSFAKRLRSAHPSSW